MTWLATPELYNNAFELVCCFFTVIAVFVSYILAMR